jgi:hypothetical protein
MAAAVVAMVVLGVVTFQGNGKDGSVSCGGEAVAVMLVMVVTTIVIFSLTPRPALEKRHIEI